MRTTLNQLSLTDIIEMAKQQIKDSYNDKKTVKEQVELFRAAAEKDGWDISEGSKLGQSLTILRATLESAEADGTAKTAAGKLWEKFSKDVASLVKDDADASAGASNATKHRP